MKKISILIFILLSIFLTSCSNEGELGLDIKEKTIKSENKKIIQEITDNTDIENQRTEEIKQIINNNKQLIKHKDGNIYLYENGKQIDYLTSRATGQKECDWDRKESSITGVWGGKDNFYSYDILQNNGKYGIVKKFTHRCGIGGMCAGPSIDYYVINLDTNSDELTKLSDDLVFSGFHCVVDDYKMETIGDTFKIKINKLNTLLGNDSGVSVNDIKNNLFKKEGNSWVKNIDLNKTLGNKNISNYNKISNGKYLHNNLINNGYKLNILGNINEYYKVISHDEVSEKDKDGIPMIISRGYTENNTIYIEGNNILDFSTHLSGGNWLTINYPKKEGNMYFEISQYSFNACQPIFGCDKEKIIINDLNTINFINSDKGINKTIWERK